MEELPTSEGKAPYFFNTPGMNAPEVNKLIDSMQAQSRLTTRLAIAALIVSIISLVVAIYAAQPKRLKQHVPIPMQYYDTVSSSRVK